MHLLNIGFGSLISLEKLVSVVAPESAPIKRLIQESRERGQLIDASFGRKTKSVLIMDNNLIVLSSLTPEVIAARINGEMSEVNEDE